MVMIITLIILLILIKWFLDGYKSGRKYRIDSKGRRRFK